MLLLLLQAAPRVWWTGSYVLVVGTLFSTTHGVKMGKSSGKVVMVQFTVCLVEGPMRSL